MTINDAMAALVAELAADEIPQPLSQRFALAAIWQDLARLAGEELPAEALAVVGRALDTTIEPIMVRRGSYAEHALQFAPAD
jgi:hypothetical protein